MTDSKSNHEPMIKLEPSGVAPVISYNVPEPTSYSGRNFIDLQLGASYFKPTTPSTPASLTSLANSTDALAALVMQAASDKTLDAAPDASRAGFALSADAGESAFDLPTLLAGLKASGLEVSEKLANLDLREVNAMQRLGKRLNIYRTLYGTLAYNYVDAPEQIESTELAEIPAASNERFAAALAAPTSPDPVYSPPLDSGMDQNAIPEKPTDGGGGGGGGGTPTVTVNVQINSPVANATINGAHTGAAFQVSGAASASSGSITNVEIQVGSGAFQNATPAAAGNWSSWTYNANVPTAGQVTITARATHSGGKTSSHSVTVQVALAPPPDLTPPGLSITFPTGGQEFAGTVAGVALVNVSGTASDIQSGVQSIEVKLDEGAFSQATAVSADWSSWSKSVTVNSAGSHTITVRSTDKAGNVTTKTVGVRVNAAPPPDTQPPTVNITSPLPNANLTGPFNGVSVNVTGTASDIGGSVTKVELLVDGVVTPAQPKATNDWSAWTAVVVISQPGLRPIMARCTDAAGNTSSSTVAVNVALIPDVVSRLNRLILVESYRLSSFLGGYGAGRTIKTFSLLPGEKTKISIKTYTKTESNAKSASSILDSFTQESSDDFELSMGKEQSDKKNYNESFNYKVDASASASWGWGKASISGGVSGGTNSAREQFAKNISNAAQKHAARASAKRDVQINTSYEVKEESGEETSVERVIENINVSRTLNFVFRQMNQEFITLLHLVDVRIGFYKVVQVQGQSQPQNTYKEVTLPELDSLLEEAIVPEKRAEVRADIIRQLSNIFDYKDRRHQFVQEEPMRDINGQIIPLSQYLRVRKDYTSTYKDEASGTEISVPGIILDASKYVLRTEGVIVEALLGQGDALDSYSHGLQDAAVREKNLANEKVSVELAKAHLANQIVQNKDAEAAKIFAQLYPQPATQLAPYVIAAPKPQESSNGQPVN